MVLADGFDISLQQCELCPLNTSAPVDNAMGTCKLCDPYANPKPVFRAWGLEFGVWGVE